MIELKKNFSYLCEVSRILAIDYGLKRTGLAVTDPEQIIATALTTVRTHDLMPFLKDYLLKEKVECIVVGDPRTLSNKPSEISPQVEAFVKRLKEAFPGISLERMDERFTSKIAQQSMLLDGMKKTDRQNKELVDQRSAVLILQSFMEKIKGR